MDSRQTGYVYVLHFEIPLHHSQHYIGCTTDPLRRWTEHATGQGARIVEAAMEVGIEWRVGAIGVCSVEEMRQLERKMKSYHGAANHCEICCGGEPAAIPGTVSMPVCHVPFATDSVQLRLKAAV